MMEEPVMEEEKSKGRKEKKQRQAQRGDKGGY